MSGRPGGAPSPITPDRLVELVVDRVVRVERSHPVRVAIDGAPAAEPGAFADSLVDPLRAVGRAAIRVGAYWFWRAASLRLEHGRTDPDAYYEDWVDVDGLRREVLDRLGPGGPADYLPTLRDPVSDRATRERYRLAPAGSVLLLDGWPLLGRGLPFDLVVHLSLSAGALARRTAEADRWTLPAFARYEAEVGPAGHADVVIRVDDPRHPAVVV